VVAGRSIMTVWELIKKLEKYDLNARVLTLGYEGGYDDIRIRTEDIVFDYNDKDTWYIGRHEDVRMVQSHVDDLESLSGYHYNTSNSSKCVIIGRESNGMD
jgi:hypothetical protein